MYNFVGFVRILGLGFLVWGLESKRLTPNSKLQTPNQHAPLRCHPYAR